MFCTVCGNNLAGAAGYFCPNCGARKATQQSSGYPQYAAYPRPQTGGIAAGIVLAIIGLLLFFIGIVYFNSAEQQLARAFGYRGPETIMPPLMMIGGVIALVIGVILTIVSVGASSRSNIGAAEVAAGFYHGATQYGGYPVPQAGKGKGLASFIMGIAGVLTGLLGVVLGPVGIHLSISAKNDGFTDGMRKAGFICSIIGTVTGVLYAFVGTTASLLPCIVGLVHLCKVSTRCRPDACAEGACYFKR
jgi:predicted RNA-binding Zn-ribbon protein involved in translation (DUF1610 family)